MTTATKKSTKVTISRDGVWAGDGVWIEGEGRIDCAAVLGPDQDASDETYDLLTEALESALEDGRSEATIVRPDGEYTAVLD